MIKLDVMPYCRECQYFDAKTSEQYSHYDRLGVYTLVKDITCKYADICRRMKKLVEEEQLKGE